MLLNFQDKYARVKYSNFLKKKKIGATVLISEEKKVCYFLVVEKKEK